MADVALTDEKWWIQVRRLEELYAEPNFIPRFQPGELDAARDELGVAAARWRQSQGNNIREASEADIRHKSGMLRIARWSTGVGP